MFADLPAILEIGFSEVESKREIFRSVTNPRNAGLQFFAFRAVNGPFERLPPTVLPTGQPALTPLSRLQGMGSASAIGKRKG